MTILETRQGLRDITRSFNLLAVKLRNTKTVEEHMAEDGERLSDYHVDRCNGCSLCQF